MLSKEAMFYLLILLIFASFSLAHAHTHTHTHTNNSFYTFADFRSDVLYLEDLGDLSLYQPFYSFAHYAKTEFLLHSWALKVFKQLNLDSILLVCLLHAVQTILAI